MLKPEASVMAGLATAGVVYGIHTAFHPTVADIQGLPSGNKDVDQSERKATWLSVAVVSGVSLLAKDPTIFVIGSAATVAMAFFTRHATWTETKTGLLGAGTATSAVSGNDLADGPAMATQDYTMFGHNEFVSS
jgi:hypothetical protein